MENCFSRVFKLLWGFFFPPRYKKNSQVGNRRLKVASVWGSLLVAPHRSDVTFLTLTHQTISHIFPCFLHVSTVWGSTGITSPVLVHWCSDCRTGALPLNQLLTITYSGRWKQTLIYFFNFLDISAEICVILGWAALLQIQKVKELESWRGRRAQLGDDQSLNSLTEEQSEKK